jgi:tetratricopeptide (TPR) repeat protein
MLNKININPAKRKLIVYVILTVVTLAVYWQVGQYDFVNYDDDVYITENSNIKSGITSDALRWAFSTKYFGLWNPLVWISFMLDYQLYGLNAGGYHLTNLILHILSTLLLFLLFSRMTHAVWPSAFVAALFALHPLHVESVAWIAERKDVLSAFFGILTLYLYISYTEKPALKKYGLVLVSFVLALLSKPMVVTLPVIMILLDYWPLDRLQSRKVEAAVPEVAPITAAEDKGKKKSKTNKEAPGENISSPAVSKISEPAIAGIIPLWQLREKTPFFILSAVFSVIALYTPDNSSFQVIPLGTRMINAPVSFLTYLEKTFFPHDMTVFYPVSAQIPVWQVIGATLLIILISAAVIKMAKRLPYLFVGWFWYMVTILPVIGIVQIGRHLVADRYHYLPSIGIAIGLAWGIPSFIKSEQTRKNILFPIAIVFLAVLTFLTWRQCSYWKGSIELWSHALRVTESNDYAHNNLGTALSDAGKLEEAVEQYNKAIALTPDDADFSNNRGNAYARMGKYESAIADLNKAVSLNPDHMKAYVNRGNAYAGAGQYQLAIKDYDEAVRLQPDSADAHYNRGSTYSEMGQYEQAIEDFTQTLRLNPDYIKAYTNRGAAYAALGRHQDAVDDYSAAIRLKPDNIPAYYNRAIVYLEQGKQEPGCSDAQKACDLGNCGIMVAAKSRGYCK